MFTAYVATRGGKITFCAMPSSRAKAEETAAEMSKGADVERVGVAAYGRMVAAFKNGVRIDVESPQHGFDSKS
jgi:hypothetical protein